MSPLIAPAITAEVEVTFPMMTEPRPILTVPLLTTSPSILAASAKNSDALLFPFTTPVTTSLPLQPTFPSTCPLISKEPLEITSPLIIVPSVITETSSAVSYTHLTLPTTSRV